MSVLTIFAAVSMPLPAAEVDLAYSDARPMPYYPRQAALDCVEGEVLARFIVSDSRKPASVEIVHSRPSGVFDEAVVDALGRWRVDAEPGTELEKSFEFDLGEGVHFPKLGPGITRNFGMTAVG
ncbi:MAG: TonB family protein [Verrucomicrobia bacterium]|nr:TonB family protein [Verrucomicrobiota bacterium]